MANSLYNQINQQSMNSFIKMFKETSNPQQLIMNLASRDNRVASVLKDVQNNGGNAKSLFFQRAKEMGIDPNSIIEQLR